MNFNNAVALVSGGSSGIGLALAHQLALRGARVAITGTNPGKLRLAAASFPDPRSVMPIEFDVTDEAAWQDAFDQVELEWGHIRFVALNAGIGMGGELVEDVALATWRWAWEVNVMGVVLGLRQCLPRMRARGHEAHILMTSSEAGVWRAPTCAPYICSKAAVVALAETLRIELAETRIGLSVLLPGPVRTDLPRTSSSASPVPMDEGIIDLMSNFLATGLDPEDVASFALDRVAAEAFYIFTHRQRDEEISARHAEIAAALAVTLEGGRAREAVN